MYGQVDQLQLQATTTLSLRKMPSAELLEKSPLWRSVLIRTAFLLLWLLSASTFQLRPISTSESSVFERRPRRIDLRVLRPILDLAKRRHSVCVTGILAHIITVSGSKTVRTSVMTRPYVRSETPDTAVWMIKGILIMLIRVALFILSYISPACAE